MFLAGHQQLPINASEKQFFGNEDGFLDYIKLQHSISEVNPFIKLTQSIDFRLLFENKNKANGRQEMSAEFIICIFTYIMVYNVFDKM